MAEFEAVLCPCGSGQSYKACCSRLISGQVTAASAEQLMRSRYTAYATRDYAYLMASWHPSTRPQVLDDADNEPQWCQLVILSTEAGQTPDQQGYVEFEAHYHFAGKPGMMRERSRFVQEDGRWFYVQGEVMAEASKPGRNAPCPCGSGNKYKRCCGR